jgi:hypothetical protein
MRVVASVVVLAWILAALAYHWWWTLFAATAVLLWLWRPGHGVRRFRVPKRGGGTARGKRVVYRGQEYPSQVQAAWARHFFERGVAFEPEPERFSYDLGGGVYYRPDFWLPGEGQWVEVKSGFDQLADGQAERKAQALAQRSHRDVRLVVGYPGRHRELWFRA